MKKISLVLIFAGFFMSSCSTMKDANQKTVIKPTISTYRIPATPKGIENPTLNNEKLSSLAKSELEGAIVSMRTSGKRTIITPLADIDTTSTHDRGVIVRGMYVEGDDPFEILDNSGWEIITAYYSGGKKYPDLIDVKISDDSGNTVCHKLKPSPTSNKYLHFLNTDSRGDFITNSAGYQFTDACDGSINYISNPSLYAEWLYIALDIDDKRKIKTLRGYQLPKTKN
jgi:hypothetical protein